MPREVYFLRPDGGELLDMGNQLWYAAPLIVSLSLVYAATRHELLQPILSHALRFALQTTGLMVAVLAVLAVASWIWGG